jgi:hypothetical protein
MAEQAGEGQRWTSNRAGSPHLQDYIGNNRYPEWGRPHPGRSAGAKRRVPKNRDHQVGVTVDDLGMACEIRNGVHPSNHSYEPDNAIEAAEMMANDRKRIHSRQPGGGDALCGG